MEEGRLVDKGQQPAVKELSKVFGLVFGRAGDPLVHCRRSIIHYAVWVSRVPRRETMPAFWIFLWPFADVGHAVLLLGLLDSCIEQ